jgi:hypothetical protein
VGTDVPQENLFWVVRRSVGVDNLQENFFWVVKESGVFLSRDTEKPKIRVLEIGKKDVI